VLSFKTTKQFERDYRLLLKQGKDIEKLKIVMHKLISQQPFESRYRDHALTGNLKSHRDFHIEPDWLLIYRIDNDAQEIIFTRTGSHSQLFG
jgi:mRNA interferase YafQ